MYELKTKETDESVIDFIEQINDNKKKADAYKLLDLFSKVSNFPAKMWGSSIIGFGSYHYKYASGHEGDAACVGFSPRKANFSLYLLSGDDESNEILKGLGKYKAGKSCVYINKLEDVNADVIEQLIDRSISFINEKYK